MADTKITALTALTAADPANDVLPIVDVSDTTMAASGTTKKISINNILACSPTATLASATITGDLTVDTNVLKVDSANDRVGIGTASPMTGFKLDVVGGDLRVSDVAGDDGVEIGWSAGGNAGFVQAYDRDASAFRNLVLNNSATIDSSGNLGLGVTPSAWGSNWRANNVGTVGSFASTGAGAAPPTAMVLAAYNDNTNWKYQFASTGAARYEMTGANSGSTHAWYISAGGAINDNIAFTQAMTLDASGNLGCGITNPSHRIHALVSSGADRDIFAAQVLAASNGLQVKWNHATTTLRIICANLPTSSAGLASGTLWNDAGTIKIA